MADIAKIIEEIKGMTVLELNSLVKAIEEEFGVSAAAPVAVAGAVAAEAAPVEAPVVAPAAEKLRWMSGSRSSLQPKVSADKVPNSAP